MYRELLLPLGDTETEEDLPAGASASCQGVPDDLANPLGGGLDVLVADVGVAQGHRRVRMSEHPCHCRQRDPPGDRLARNRVPNIM